MFWKKSKKLIETVKNEFILEIDISKCVHYCAFKYGNKSYNPYENYIIDLYQGKDLKKIRYNFIEHLSYYRPKSIEESLGSLNSLSSHPLWSFPWDSCKHLVKNEVNSWYNDPNDMVDIMTMFCEKGILDFKINQEFYWLERAITKISNEGYLPDKYKNSIDVMHLKSNLDERFLVLDGNHRLSALVALGYEKLDVVVKRTVKKEDVATWQGVVENFYTVSDAEFIFDLYFNGNANPVTTNNRADIISDYVKINL